jgi:acyl-CoA synthetase (AMP-forming)/AMP-acid ligase II
MSTPIRFAETAPERPAVIFGNGEFVETYAELEQRSRRLAHALRALGLSAGDGLALLLGNEDEFFDIYWAATRIGLYFIPVNWHLQPSEVGYIVENSDARVLLASARFAKAAAEATSAPNLRHRIALHGPVEGFRSYEDLLADIPVDAPLEGQFEGSVMLYSSGTTGKPKGVRQPLVQRPFGDPLVAFRSLGLLGLFGFREGDRYLCPAPLYHAAPLAFSAGMHRVGGTSVVLRQFDPEQALRTIQDQRITTSQWVPTHFKRLLQLPEELRTRYDLASHRVAVHAAAPCSIPVKRAMIEWWAHTSILEYYAGTEGGGTLIRSQEWLEHPGSVGRHWANAKVHILDEEGGEIEEPLKDGAIYFEAAADAAQRFRYYKDDEKTRQAFRGNLFTLGDIGHLDADGFLYLTDRQSNMIISGGVNIYPQETENVLIAHAKVSDVAVIGVPNDEMGEEVKAVVIPAPGVQPGPDLERELIEHCRAQIAHYKCPRSIDFAEDLPRQPTGKLYKRMIRAQYWQDRESALV